VNFLITAKNFIKWVRVGKDKKHRMVGDADLCLWSFMFSVSYFISL
jgi:hypothetical protein